MMDDAGRVGARVGAICFLEPPLGGGLMPLTTGAGFAAERVAGAADLSADLDACLAGAAGGSLERPREPESCLSKDFLLRARAPGGAAAVSSRNSRRTGVRAERAGGGQRWQGRGSLRGPQQLVACLPVEEPPIV